MLINPILCISNRFLFKPLLLLSLKRKARKVLIAQDNDCTNHFLSFLQMHTILDEMIVGGQVVETNSEIIMQAVEEISK